MRILPPPNKLRAQATIEALFVLLAMLLLLQILSLSLQTFNSNYNSIYFVSSEQQTLASQALIVSVRVCDVGVRLPLSFHTPSQTQDEYLISPTNSSIHMPVLGPPPAQKILS